MLSIETNKIERREVMPTPIALPSLPLEAITSQAASVFGTFGPVLALVVGVALGVFLLRRLVRAVRNM